VEILNLLDDHSRLSLGSLPRRTITGPDVAYTFQNAFLRWGIPAGVLTDNGAVFTGRQRGGGRVALEVELGRLGVRFDHSRPYHPQTCGKVERLHRTQRQWLARRNPPATLAHAQALMDRFGQHYNHDRPHQALNGLAPADRYRPGQPLLLPTTDLEPADYSPPGALPRKTSPTGRFTYANHTFDLGERFAGITITVQRDHARLHAYYGSSLIDTFLVGTNLPTPTR
jgi:hypothetical protein